MTKSSAYRMGMKTGRPRRLSLARLKTARREISFGSVSGLIGRPRADAFVPARGYTCRSYRSSMMLSATLLSSGESTPLTQKVISSSSV